MEEHFSCGTHSYLLLLPAVSASLLPLCLSPFACHSVFFSLSHSVLLLLCFLFCDSDLHRQEEALFFGLCGECFLNVSVLSSLFRRERRSSCGYLPRRCLMRSTWHSLMLPWPWLRRGMGCWCLLSVCACSGDRHVLCLEGHHVKRCFLFSYHGSLAGHPGVTCVQLWQAITTFLLSASKSRCLERSQAHSG